MGKSETREPINCSVGHFAQVLDLGFEVEFIA